jgi:hypothetical protein
MNTRNCISLGDKVRLVNYLVENRNSLQAVGLSKLADHVKVVLNINVSGMQLSKTYRPEAGYPPLRADTRPAQKQEQDRIEALEARIEELERRIANVEVLWS